MNDFIKLLKPMKYNGLYFVKGSRWHTDKENTSFEEIVADKLNVKKYKSVLGNQTHADYEATIEMFGKHIHFTHRVGWSSWWMYRTTPIAKELIKMHFAHKENGFHTDVNVNSHVHYFVLVQFPNTIGFSTPAWKFPDGFLYRKGQPELPSIGMIEIIIEPNGKIEIEPHLVQTDFKKPVIHL